MFVKLLSLFCVLGFAKTYPSGAPAYACETMEPQHSPNVSLPNEDSPYKLSLSSNKYSKGKQITLTISSNGKNYSGMFVQVRAVNNSETVGKMTLAEDDLKHRYQSCGTTLGAVTHATPDYRSLPITIQWHAPTDTNHGDLQFYVTMSYGFEIYYTKLLSEKMTYYNSAFSTTHSASMFVVISSWIAVCLFATEI